MKNPIKWPSKMVNSGGALAAVFKIRLSLTCSLKIEYTVLKARNLRDSDIRCDARMVSQIPERSTRP